MNKLIAYCGLDCEQCEARIATVNRDESMKVKKHCPRKECRTANKADAASGSLGLSIGQISNRTRY